MKTIVLPALAAALALAACSGSGNNSSAAANDAAFADNATGDVLLNDEFPAAEGNLATDNALGTAATDPALGNGADPLGNTADNAATGNAY